MANAEYVFALLLVQRHSGLVLFQHHDPDTWTLPGGLVHRHETEFDALEHRLEQQWKPNGRIVIGEQVGRLWRLPSGKTAKTFICHTDGDWKGEGGGDFAQHSLITLADLWQIELECEPIKRMVYDGFTILAEPTVVPRDIGLDFEGIIEHPRHKHLLVEIYLDQQRQWHRLDPDGPDGKMAIES